MVSYTVFLLCNSFKSSTSNIHQRHTWFVVVIDLDRNRRCLAHNVFPHSLKGHTRHTLAGDLRGGDKPSKKICTGTHRKAYKHRVIKRTLHSKMFRILCKHWWGTLSSPSITTHTVFFRPWRTQWTHLIKVEQHFSPIQLISLQTHTFVHQQL